ncbi:MAG: hypothetical protein AAF628_02260 [Planctomycetota bacterium]
MTASDAPQHAEPRRCGWLDYAGLLVLQILLLQGFTQHVDVHAADEVMYQQQGLALIEGRPETKTLGFGPVYSAAYGVVQLAPLGGVAVQDAMAVVLTIGGTLAVAWALVAFVPRSAALFAAIWWGSQPGVLEFPFRVYLFNGCLVLLTLGCLGRRRPVLGLSFLALAAFNRLELLPWLGSAALGMAAVGHVRGRPRLRAVGLGFIVASVGVLLLSSASPHAKEHSWLAFRDHYVGNQLAPEGALPMIGAPVEQQEGMIEAAFPGAHSVFAALAANPGAFVDHVLHNAAFLPEMVLANLRFPFYYLAPVAYTLLASALLLMLLGAWPAWRSAPPRPPASARIALWTSWLIIPGLLVVFPRSGFMLPVSIAVLVLGARLVHRGASALGRGPLAHLPVSELLLATSIGIAVAAGGPFSRVPAVPVQGREILAMMQRNEIGPDDRVAAIKAPGLLALAQVDAVGVEIDRFAMDPKVEADFAFFSSWEHQAPFAPALLQRLTTGDAWRVVDVAYGALLFRREERR